MAAPSLAVIYSLYGLSLLQRLPHPGGLAQVSGLAGLQTVAGWAVMPRFHLPPNFLQGMLFLLSPPNVWFGGRRSGVDVLEMSKIERNPELG